MEVVFRIVQSGPSRQKILDIPAGNGRLSARLRETGHEVVCADINRANADYVYADLDEPLPFGDAEFDTCLCMEGIEHTLDPVMVIREFCRITKPGGRIVLTLPNIQNLYSRFKFLCTGYFNQFDPGKSRHLKPGEKIDRGHISPLGYLRLRYLFQNFGAHVVAVQGDRWKKKWLFPFLLPFAGIGWPWSHWELNREPDAPREQCIEMLRHLRSPSLLFSRSLILTFVRKGA